MMVICECLIDTDINGALLFHIKTIICDLTQYKKQVYHKASFAKLSKAICLFSVWSELQYYVKLASTSLIQKNKLE